MKGKRFRIDDSNKSFHIGGAAVDLKVSDYTPAGLAREITKAFRDKIMSSECYYDTATNSFKWRKKS